MIDVLVAGGGPVGLATALAAARQGLEVVIAEPRHMPVDKACGEGLMPAARTQLARWDIDELPGHDLAGIRYLDEGHTVDARFRAGPGRGVRRTHLADRLREAAVAAGVRIEDVALDAPRQSADHVFVNGFRARYFVAADGVHSRIAAGLGLVRPRRGLRRWGLRAHIEVKPWTDFVEVHIAPDAEAYVTPVGDRLIGVAIMSSRRASFPAQLRDFPALREQLGNNEFTPVLGAGPLRHSTTRRVAGRVLLAGDAAGYVDSLTGEGLAVGFAGAAAIARALAADRPQDWENDWRRVTRTSRWLTHGLLWVATHPTRRLLVPASAAAPAVFRTVVRALGGE